MAIHPASTMAQPFSGWWPITVVSTLSAMIHGIDAHVVHHQVEHGIDTGTHLGHAAQVFGAQGGRGGADADHLAGQAGFAQAIGGTDAAGAFLFGHGDEGGVVVMVVAGAGMGDHAAEAHAAGVEHLAHGQQGGVFRGDAGAVAIHVDFNPDFKTFLLRLAEGHDGLGTDHAVGHDLEIAALATQCQRLAQLGGGHADGVDDVGDAGGKELLGSLRVETVMPRAPACNCACTTCWHLVVLTCGRKRTPSASMRCCMRAMLCSMREMSIKAAGVGRVARLMGNS
jgi:hypothetical protein